MSSSLAGAFYSWGYNLNGCLGDGTRVSRSAPVRVQLPDRAVRAATAHTSTCALLQRGQVWCWGSFDNTLLPVLIFGSDTHVGHVPRSIVAGANHFCVVVTRARADCGTADVAACHAVADDNAEVASAQQAADTVW